MRCPKRDIANISGGLPGEVPYQTDTSLTTFTNQGNPGDILTIVGSIPAFTPPAIPPVSSVSNNVAGGLANQVLYQSSPSNTTFTNQGTSGQLLTIVGITPTFANPAKPPSVAGGLANEVLYQSAPNVTAFTNQGTNGQVLTIVGSTPTFSTPPTPSTSTNLAGGIAYQVPYQDAPNSTSFTNVGNEGDFLQIYSGVPTFVNFRVPTVTQILGGPEDIIGFYSPPTDCVYLKITLVAGGGGSSAMTTATPTLAAGGGGGGGMIGVFPAISFHYQVGQYGDGGQTDSPYNSALTGGKSGIYFNTFNNAPSIEVNGGGPGTTGFPFTPTIGGGGGAYSNTSIYTKIILARGGSGRNGAVSVDQCYGGSTIIHPTGGNNDNAGDGPTGSGRGGATVGGALFRNGNGGSGQLYIEEYYQ